MTLSRPWAWKNEWWHQHRRKRSNRNNNNDMKWRNERQFWHPSQQEALPILHGAYSITTSICYLLLLLLFAKHSSFLFFVLFSSTSVSLYLIEYLLLLNMLNIHFRYFMEVSYCRWNAWHRSEFFKIFIYV